MTNQAFEDTESDCHLAEERRDDESQIYPGVAEHLGGDDPLAAMSRTHQEIRLDRG